MSGIERLTLKKGFAGGKLKKLRVAREKDGSNPLRSKGGQPPRLKLLAGIGAGGRRGGRGALQRFGRGIELFL